MAALVPAGKHMAWMAAIALATILAFESYKAKKVGVAPAGPVSSLFGRAGL